MVKTWSFTSKPAFSSPARAVTAEFVSTEPEPEPPNTGSAAARPSIVTRELVARGSVPASFFARTMPPAAISSTRVLAASSTSSMLPKSDV
ncbi:hypothetical protein D3C74_375770 [compost metagenome]